MLPNIQGKEGKAQPLMLKLHRCAGTLGSARGSTSLPRARSVIFTARTLVKRPQEEDEDEAVTHFRQSLKNYEELKRVGSLLQGRYEATPASPRSPRTSIKPFPNLNLVRQSIIAQSSPSPFTVSLIPAFPPPSEPAKEGSYSKRCLESKAVRRLPLPGATDFEHTSSRLRKPVGRRGSQVDLHIYDDIQRDKHAILNLLPAEYVSRAHNETPALNLAEGSQLFWSLQSTSGSKPEAREGACIVWLNRRLYMFGGVSMTKRNEVRALNPDTWSWSMITAQYMPKGRVGHSMVACGSMLVVYGGWSHYSQRLHMRRCYKKVFVLHMDSEVKWQRYRGNGEVPKARRYHAATALGSTMVVYGGIDMHNKILRSLCTLEMDNFEWTKQRLESGPGPLTNSSFTAVFHPSLLLRSDFSAFAMPKLKIEQHMANSGFYLFGGLNDESQVTNEIWILSVVDNVLVWRKPETQGPVPHPRCDHSTVFLNTCLIVYGGRGISEATPPTLSLLRIESLTWERVILSGTIPPPRWSHCASFLGSKMLVIGGLFYQSFQPSDLYLLETDSPYSVELTKQYNERQAMRANLANRHCPYVAFSCERTLPQALPPACASQRPIP